MPKYAADKSRYFLVFVLTAVSAAAMAGLDEDIEKALNLEDGKYGKVNFDVRYRYEYIDQDSNNQITPVTIKNQAHASTLRTRLGYLTPVWQGLTGFAEYEGNQDIGINDYNSTFNGKRAYPIVADPQDNEINQLWLNYAGVPDTHIKLGRQRIAFDNHRFIGDVGWRQMQQTFDAATITNKSLPDTTITAGYIAKVQDITSRSVGMQSPIFNIAYAGIPYGKLIVHGEWLDYDNPNEAFSPNPLMPVNTYANSTKTTGVRFDGSTAIMDNLKAVYTAEYAHQEDYKNNPRHYKTDYWLTEGGVDVYGVVVKAAMENLGSNNGTAFQTPLATLHAFQGWADKFLTTPGTGLRDTYGTIKTTQLGIEWTAVYHEFSDGGNNVDYGHEIDFMAEKKFGKHYGVMFKYANFVGDSSKNARNTFSDTQKLWVQGSVNF